MCSVPQEGETKKRNSSNINSNIICCPQQLAKHKEASAGLECSGLGSCTQGRVYEKLKLHHQDFLIKIP